MAMKKNRRTRPILVSQAGVNPLKAVLLGLTGLLCVSCVHRNAPTQKGFEDARSTMSQLEAVLEPKRWAVVIGVNDYQDETFKGLKHAADDAADISRVLRDPEVGAFDRVITLTSREQTTREAILSELTRLRFDLRRQDTFVFYFSGHGTVEFTKDGQPLLYLVASDTRASDFWGTAIEVGALRTFVNELKPQRKVIILDNCFAGQGKSRISAVTREKLAESPEPWPSLREALAQSEAILMASTLGGTAHEDNALGQGVFTHYLIQGLTTERLRADANGDGAITVYELHDYARSRTVEHTSGVQIPEAYFRVLGRAETFLAGTPSPDIAHTAALVYAYGTNAANGLTLQIDGQVKGVFPRTLSVEPGTHQVAMRNQLGEVLAEGPMKFSSGQTYSAGSLMEELEGYRRYIGLETGPTIQLAGPIREVWGDEALRVGLVSGYRVRGGLMRGLSVSFSLGWNPSYGGVWVDLTDQEWRSLIDFGARAVLRRSLGRFQGGAGWQVGAIYTPPVKSDGNQLESADTRQYLHSWVNMQGGPMLWQGYAIDRHLLLTLEQRVSWFRGDFQDSWGSTRNFQVALTAGIEVGF